MFVSKASRLCGDVLEMGEVCVCGVQDLLVANRLRPKHAAMGLTCLDADDLPMTATESCGDAKRCRSCTFVCRACLPQRIWASRHLDASGHFCFGSWIQ